MYALASLGLRWLLRGWRGTWCSTGRATETKGRQGVHPTPCRAPSAAPATQKPPAEHRRPRDARAYIRPLAEHQVPHLPRNKPPETKGCQGVHPKVPRLPRKSHLRDARAYIRPLAEHQVPHLPRKSHRQTGGDQGTPGCTSNRLQSTKCRTCHAKATGRPAETKGRQGVHPTPCRALSATPARQKPPETKGRQGVHPTPCAAPSAVPATQKPPAERRRPKDARAYIRPLAEHQVPHLPRKATGRAAETKGRQGVHPTEAPHLPRKSHRQSGGDEGTPGRPPDRLQSTKRRTCHAKATGRAAETKGRQGVHPTPRGAPSAAPATQKPPAERRRPRDARAHIRPLAEHQMPRKRHRQPSL